MGNNDDDPLRSIKIDLRSILVSEQDPLTAREVAQRYIDHFDYALDPTRYNCANLDILLQSMPDVIQVVRSHVRTHPNRYRAAACEATRDIESLVRRQLTKQQACNKRARHNSKMMGSFTAHKPTQYGAAFRYDTGANRGKIPVQRTTQSMVPIGGIGAVSRFSVDHVDEEPNEEMTRSISESIDNPQIFHEQAARSSSSTSIGRSTIASHSAVSISHGQFGEALQKLQRLFPEVGRCLLLGALQNEAKTVVNINPAILETRYNVHNGKVVEEVQLLKPINPNHMSHMGANVRNALESDLIWLGTTQNVIDGLQRFDKVAVMQMMSPNIFLVSSCYGNVNAARFSEVAKVLRRIAETTGFRPVQTFKPGMGCIIHQDGEHARAVLLSKARRNGNPGFLRFACMDYRAIVEVHNSQVFHITEELKTRVIPCNLFLARIHGISPIHQEFWDSVADSISAEMEESGVVKWTPCIFFGSDHRYGPVTFVIDFVLRDHWFSELLICNDMASLFRKEPTPRKDRALTPAVVSQTLEILEKSDVFAFRNLKAKAEFAFSDASIIPNYDRILNKILTRPIPSREEHPTLREAVSFGACSPVPAEIIPNDLEVLDAPPNEIHHQTVSTTEDHDYSVMANSVLNILNFSDAHGEKAADANMLLTAYGWSVLAAAGTGKETTLDALLKHIGAL